MQKYLFLYALLTTALLVFGIRHYRKENQRLTNNQTALGEQVRHYRTQWGAEVASTQVLRLRIGEFETLRAADAAQIKSLGIKLRRAESYAKSATRSHLEFRAPLRDTLVIRRSDTVLIRDTVRFFRWRDRWVSVEGQIEHDSVACRVTSVDTLRQVVHRIPRRFLFFRWGTRALRQEITSSNPHTQIVFTEFVRIERSGRIKN